jgi:polyferredoxin
MNAERRKQGLPDVYKFIRARTVLYTIIISLVGGIMVYGLMSRSHVGIAVLHQRNPLFVALSDGSIRNDYTVRFLNRTAEKKLLVLALEGLDGAKITADDANEGKPGEIAFSVAPDTTRELRLHISYPQGQIEGQSKDVIFRATDPATGETSTAKDHFIVR